MRSKYLKLPYFAGVLYLSMGMAACADTNDRTASEANIARSRSQTKPTNFLTWTNSDAPFGLDFAYSLAQALAFEASCNKYVNASGITVIDCQTDTATCRESYAPSGHFMSWDCGSAGSYACLNYPYGFDCVMASVNGSITCQETYDKFWNALTSSCYGGPAAYSQCDIPEDNSDIVCDFSEQLWYAYSADCRVSYASDYLINLMSCGDQDDPWLDCTMSTETLLTCSTTNVNGGNCRTTYDRRSLREVEIECN